jgi:hypothetical protein
MYVCVYDIDTSWSCVNKSVSTVLWVVSALYPWTLVGIVILFAVTQMYVPVHLRYLACCTLSVYNIYLKAPTKTRISTGDGWICL